MLICAVVAVVLLAQLFTDVVPKTCANFRALCTGECGESPSSEFKLHYDKSIIHRIVPNGWIQGGGECMLFAVSLCWQLMVIRQSQSVKPS